MRDNGRDTLEAVGDLGVHGVLDPQVPVLIKGGDAFLRGYEAAARSVNGALHEADDRLFRCAIVPGRQRVTGLGPAGRANLGQGQEGRVAAVDSTARRVTPERRGRSFIGSSLGSV